MNPNENQKKYDELIEIKKTIGPLIIICFIILTYSFYKKDQFVQSSTINKLLHHEPEQTEIENIKNREAFVVQYYGKNYIITPIANYKIHGLLVSHNNPKGIGDIYHDESSFDTKDFCLIWGDNVKNNDFHKVEFWNVSFTCNYRYSENLKFDPTKFSNNHLITDNQAIRDTIEKIHLGDQLEISGYLVNYREEGNQNSIRKTSLTRTDIGNGACEVLFVKELKVLEKNNPFLNQVYHYGRYLLLFLILFYLYLFFRSNHFYNHRF